MGSSVITGEDTSGMRTAESNTSSAQVSVLRLLQSPWPPWEVASLSSYFLGGRLARVARGLSDITHAPVTELGF